ncbi:hypothetical protein PC128_g17220 [Phytophthora cactorum]|nr:hypothetical protein PC128_g17220 [Phytophthora cactorum]
MQHYFKKLRAETRKLRTSQAKIMADKRKQQEKELRDHLGNDFEDLRKK